MIMEETIEITTVTTTILTQEELQNLIRDRLNINPNAKWREAVVFEFDSKGNIETKVIRSETTVK
jgi:hypothetical protein